MSTQKALFSLVLVVALSMAGTPSRAQVPKIGSQVGIPDDAAQIDSLFKTLAEHNMPVARIWVELDPFHPDRWDFTRYDQAFDAAEKYGVGISPTLGPAGTGVSVMLKERENVEAAQNYIEAVVTRYRDHPALDHWMLLNEPGTFPAPNPLAMDRFREWLREKYGSVDQLWGDYSSFDQVTYEEDWEEGPSRAFVDWHAFWRSHMTWYLQWIADEVRKHDEETPLHANGHSLIGNVVDISTDLPSWREPLDVLGGSMHPSWHFGGLLDRDQYALGAAYESDLLQGSSEPEPFWITELQGGNNLYRPAHPFHPSDKDIAQFLWTIVGSGADRALFWTLNPSSEWSLLDFQGRPSERIKTAGRVAQTLNTHADFFSEAEPVETPITILVSLETMTLQLATEGWTVGASEDYVGRKRDAHVLAALAYYEAFQDLGIPVRIKHMHDFDWQDPPGDDHLAILPHVTSVTSDQAKHVESFVQNGNTVLVSGLTGIYDEYREFWPTESKFPLRDALGGRYKEIRLPEPYGQVSLVNPDVTLPYHLWVGDVESFESRPIGEREGRVIATVNEYGEGESIWIPSMIGLGAWEKDNESLESLLEHYASDFTRGLPFRFDASCDGVVARVLKRGDQYVTVTTNGTENRKRCVLDVRDRELSPDVLWGDPGQTAMRGRELSLGPRETVVLLWK